jgi:hypothetical protein
MTEVQSSRMEPKLLYRQIRVFAENCCSLQSLSWISSKLLSQNHDLLHFKEPVQIQISSTQPCHSYSVVWVFCLVQNHVQ